nr:probable serine/threonine-protein kinase At4g35230 [Tanacetum cinerariifolium]
MEILLEPTSNKLMVAGNPVKKILLKLNLSDHSSILTDLQVTPTKPGRMTKPYSSYRFIANCFNAGNSKMKVKVPSYQMLGIPKHEEAPATPPHPLSPMGDACSRMDLTAIHQILVMTHYKDDEGTNELSFQEWTQQMRDMLEARKRGDLAFRDKDFRTAIDCYSQVDYTLCALKNTNVILLFQL